MSAPVDVLAVMDAHEKARHSEWFSMHDKYFGRIPGIEKELNKLKAAQAEAASARAAVTELIEAAKRIAEYADDDYVPNVAFARLIQALAAVGGAK